MIVMMLLPTNCISNNFYHIDSNGDTVWSYSNGEHDNEIMAKKPNIPTTKELKEKTDSLKNISKDVYNIVKDGMKNDGIRGYMRNHMDVFIPVVFCIIFWLVWLAGKAKMRN